MNIKNSYLGIKRLLLFLETFLDESLNMSLFEFIES